MTACPNDPNLETQLQPSWILPRTCWRIPCSLNRRRVGSWRCNLGGDKPDETQLLTAALFLPTLTFLPLLAFKSSYARSAIATRHIVLHVNGALEYMAFLDASRWAWFVACRTEYEASVWVVEPMSIDTNLTSDDPYLLVFNPNHWTTVLQALLFLLSGRLLLEECVRKKRDRWMSLNVGFQLSWSFCLWKSIDGELMTDP